MRIILSWIDQLRRTTVEHLPNYCSALVSQLSDIANAANKWASIDHNSDGTHSAVRFYAVTTEPEATVAAMTVWWDGTNLKYKKPDGTTGNLV